MALPDRVGRGVRFVGAVGDFEAELRLQPTAEIAMQQANASMKSNWNRTVWVLTIVLLCASRG